jgi:RimJ/RimL family protein N-acetyltransferase
LGDVVDALDQYEFTGKSDTIAEETRHMGWEPHETPKETVDFHERVDDKWESGEGAVYAVVPRDGEDGSGTFAGTAGLHPDWDRRSAGLGIWLRKPFWGRGYSGERAGALLDLAFERLDLDVVHVEHQVGNEQSRRAVEKYVERFGGRREGLLRNGLVTDDGPVDVRRYSIARDEWRDAVAADRPEVTYP